MSSARLPVKSLRERLGLTGKQFAQKLGASERSVIRWENGHVRPSSMATQRMRDLHREHLARQRGDQAPTRLSPTPSTDAAPEPAGAAGVVPSRVPPQRRDT